MRTASDRDIWPASTGGPGRQIWLASLIGAVSAGVGCSVFVGARVGGVPPEPASVMALLAVTAWVILSAGAFAAGAQGWFAALLRGGVVADASVITLIVLGVWGGGVVGWAVAVKAYVIWAGLAAAAVAVTRLGRSPRGRAALALGVVLAASLAGSSLFWSSGPLSRMQGPARDLAAKAMLAANPLYGVAEAARPTSGFIWFRSGLMYTITRMGEDYPAADLDWWAPAAVWWLLAGAVAAAVGARRAWRGFLYGA